MNINKDRTIAILNDILSHISGKKMSYLFKQQDPL